MDEPPHRRSLRGPRGPGSAVAEPVHDGRGRGPAPPRCARTRCRSAHLRPGRGGRGPRRPGGRSPELDAAAAGGGDRTTPGRAHLTLAVIGGAAEKRGFGRRRPRHTLKGRQDADAADRAGLRGQLLKAQAAAGDIVLLFGDESEALTHPYLAHVWAKKGADLRVPAPGQAAKIAMIGAFDWARRELIVQTSPRKRSADFIAFLEELDRRYGPKPGQTTKPVRLVLDNGPIHTSKATRAALAARASWLSVEWLPKYAPELNAIERVWRDLKRHHLAPKTFTGREDLADAIHEAVRTLNTERNGHSLTNLCMAA